MITTLVLAFGLVLVIEGLVLALAPSRLEDLLARLAEIPVEARRVMGLLAISIGLIICSLVLSGVG
ncbi:MAG: hypothetical protein ACI9IV_001600 [Paracoccaceae bacterium]|jgi:uncharacterized protein YjeT (DUF2065 family)